MAAPIATLKAHGEQKRSDWLLLLKWLIHFASELYGIFKWKENAFDVKNGITTEGFSCVNFPFSCAIVGLNTAASLCGLIDGKPSSEIWLVQFQIACLPSFQFPFPNVLHQPLTRYVRTQDSKNVSQTCEHLASPTRLQQLHSSVCGWSRLSFRERKVFKYVLEFSDPGDWSLRCCLSSPVESSWCAAPPHLPQAVGAWHDVWLLRAAVLRSHQESRW